MQTLLRQLRVQQERNLDEVSQKWGFDFRNGRPEGASAPIHR